MVFPTEGSLVEATANPDGKRSLQEIETFVTRIWEHPLLTSKTSEHRNKGKKLFEEYLSQKGLNKDDYVGIPFGSSVWITDDNSDFDFNVIAKNKQSKIALSGLLFQEGTPHGLSIDNIGNLDTIESGGSIPYYLKDMFFTSDDYLSGNLELAKNTRSKMASFMQSDSHSFWEKELIEHFDHYYKGWPVSKEYTLGYPDGAIKGEIRSARTNNAIVERGLLTKMGPEKYAVNFAIALHNFTVPKLDTYLKGLKYSNGQLHIRSYAKSQGIK